MTHITNIYTKKSYSGRNLSDLRDAMKERGYNTPVFGTIRQFNMAGRRVRAGEHASARVFMGYQETVVTDEEGKQKTEYKPVGFAPVFNYEQTL